MRSLLILITFLYLFSCVSAIQLFNREFHGSLGLGRGWKHPIPSIHTNPTPFNSNDDVLIPYSNCGSSSDHLKIINVTSTSWPPTKGSMFQFNLTGTVDEQVTSGEYTLQVSYLGIPIINQNGDLSAFVKLPAGPGPVLISDSEQIPGSAPSGPYVVEFSATDQNKQPLVCLQIKFSLDAEMKSLPITSQLSRSKSN